jgi:hypothetical protein
MLKIYLRFLQKNGVLKLAISITLYIILGLLFNLTNNSLYLNLMIIPSLYVVPMIITAFVYSFIIYPISLLRKK